MFCKKGALRKFAKFAGKNLCQRLFFNKVAGPMSASLLKKGLWHRCFPVNFAKFLRTSFFTEHLRWSFAFTFNPLHYVKSVQIRSFFWSVFSCIYSVFSPNIGKYGQEKAPYLDIFHTVLVPRILKRSHINKQTCSSKLQVCLRICDLIVDTSH